MNLVPASRTAVDGGDALDCLGAQRPARGPLTCSATAAARSCSASGRRTSAGRARPGPTTTCCSAHGSRSSSRSAPRRSITVAIADQRLIARFPPRAGISPGENVELAFDPSHVHVFDPGSGASVLHHEA